MILRDRCSTSYDLASLFRGMRSTLDRWSGKIAKRIGTRPSAPHSTSQNCCQVQKLRKSRRIASFWMVSSSKIEEVSQNFSLWMLSSSKIEEVSQNSCVFKPAGRQTADRQTDR